MATIEKRINSKGEIKWRALIRIKGHATQSATFARKTDANKWANQTETAIHEGRHFKSAEAKKHTMGADTKVFNHNR